MQETLYDNMLASVKGKVSHEHENVVEVVVKSCVQTAIQDKIVMIKIINQNLGLHVERIKILSDNEPIKDSGKIEGIKLAIENNLQEIRALENQIR